MQIRVLGHLEASVDDRPLAFGGAKQRAVLAMLGLEANRAVTADRLIEGLWGEAPPSAAKMVQNYVWRLRKLLDDDGGAEIVTRGRAYELRIDREQVDACRLERLVSEAARGRGRRAGEARRARRSRCSAASRSRTSPTSRSRPRDPPARGAAPDRRRAGDRRRPGRRPPPGDRRRDRRAAGGQPAPRAAARPADARPLPLRAPGRGARGLPPCAADAGRRDRRRAVAGAAAPARRDPAPGPALDVEPASPSSSASSTPRRRRR